MPDNDEFQDMKDPGYEIFIAMVSILSVINLFITFLPVFSLGARNVINIIDIGLTVIFIADFSYRMITAKSRSYYFIRDWGWADLLACVPMFRIFRFFRIVKAYKIIKKLGPDNIKTQLSRNRAELAVYILIFSVILILEVGSSWVLLAESSSPDANITNANDAIWWAYVTITTVGYGDRYPVTTLGRIVGIIVMTTGVGIFATFAGYLSSKLLSPSKKLEEMEAEEHDFEREMIDRIDELKRLLKDQDSRNNEIGTRLERIETLLATERTVIHSGSEHVVRDTNDSGISGKPVKKPDFRSKFWRNISSE
ncbi:MAG TPA: ion transporter [Methanoregulaceae archaeon]|nr:ion transporter [Methanoregulaceae archaeon]